MLPNRATQPLHDACVLILHAGSLQLGAAMQGFPVHTGALQGPCSCWQIQSPLLV